MTLQDIYPENIKSGDIIQTGIIYSNGDGSIKWCSHQVVRRVSTDGKIWYRPKNAKVDKTPYLWRLPVEPQENIIRDLKHYANPKDGKKAIKRLLENATFEGGEEK